jgi:hypothetical protein
MTSRMLWRWKAKEFWTKVRRTRAQRAGGRPSRSAWVRKERPSLLVAPRRRSVVERIESENLAVRERTSVGSTLRRSMVGPKEDKYLRAAMMSIYSNQ